MLERVPVHIAPAAQHLVAPLQKFQIVFDGVFTEPVDEFVVRDACLPLGAPNLHRPREHTHVVIHPVVEHA